MQQSARIETALLRASESGVEWRMAAGWGAGLWYGAEGLLRLWALRRSELLYHRLVMLGVEPADVVDAMRVGWTPGRWVAHWQRRADRSRVMAQGATDLTAIRALRASAMALRAAEPLALRHGDATSMARQWTDDIERAAALSNGDVQSLIVMTPLGPLHALYHRPPEVSEGQSLRPPVILTTDLYGGRDDVITLVNVLVRNGWPVLTTDMPGQGTSCLLGGVTFEPGQEACVRALLDHAQQLPGLQTGSAVLLGMGIGGFWALRAAALDPRIKAVCAVSSPYSLDFVNRVGAIMFTPSMDRRFGAYRGADRKSMLHSLTLEGYLSGVHGSALLIHGLDDTYVDRQEAYRIFEELGGPKRILTYEGADHFCVERMGDWVPSLITWMAQELLVGMPSGLERGPRAVRPEPVVARHTSNGLP